MTRALSFVVALVLIVGLAWAKKGNGNGNGGGGGENLSGVLYVFLETPTYSQIAFGTSDPVGSFALNTDGSVAQELTGFGEWPPLGEASYELHDDARVFLSCSDVAGANPDGTSRQVLAATQQDGTVVELTNAGDQLRIVGGAWPAVRWGKDDSFVSFAAIVWDGSGDASTHIFEAPVAWDASGVPSLSAAPSIVVDGTVTIQSGHPVKSSLDGHDWSADASELVYEDGSLIKVNTIGSGTTTLANAGDAESANGDPRWSPASDRIAYVDGWEVYLIDSDGSGGAQFAAGYFARWSPDGSHVVLVRNKNIKIKGRANYTSDIYIGAANGNSSPTKVTSGLSDRIGRFQGWR